MSDTELMDMPKAEPVRRLEVFTGAGRRRSWTAEQKARIGAETCAEGATVSAVARRHGLTAQQLFAWRRKAADDVLFKSALTLKKSFKLTDRGGRSPYRYRSIGCIFC